MIRIILSLLVFIAFLAAGELFTKRIAPNERYGFHIGWNTACIALLVVQVFIIRR
jgi:hypothetical protein